MGSYDGAETCDIVGLYILSKLKDIHPDVYLGLFRDDGMGESSLPPNQLDDVRKKIIAVFKKLGLKIEIHTGKKEVDFLDVTLNLDSDTYKPFLKENNTPLYVHSESNHPRKVLNNIPDGVNKRLSAISSNEEMFWTAAPRYQDALRDSGHYYQMKYDPPANTQNKRRRNRKRYTVTYFNPPFALNVKTNIGAKFLQLIDKHFPPSHSLSKLINRNTVKISYKCTPNLAKLISGHNSKIISESLPQPVVRKCNCPKKAVCPLNGKCLEKNVIYQATVISSDGDTQKYIGLSAPRFKERLANHTKSFKHTKYAHETTLSTHVWELKEKKLDFEIKWQLMATAKPFSPVTNVCDLCTREKYFILFKPELATLNCRNEMNTNCRHKKMMLLDNT